MHVIVPVLLTVALFAITMHLFILPVLERQMMDRKRETIRELTNSVISMLDSYEEQVRRGERTREDAMRAAAARIAKMRYGPENKDYFWINDMRPYMVVHPYRPDLNGKDISHYKDPNGKRLFVEFVRVVQAYGSGYVDYMWQWKDDPARIVPKISYVRGFKPWGWIVGTGIYVQDVQAEIGRIRRMLVNAYLGVLAVMAALSSVVIRNSLVIENRRARAERKLRDSTKLYSTLVENVNDMVFLLDARGNAVFANSYACSHYGMEQDKIQGIPLCFFFCGISMDQVDRAVDTVRRTRIEFSLDCQCEDTFYLLSIVPLVDNAGIIEGMICLARDITQRKIEQLRIEEMRRRYQTLFETAGDGILVLKDDRFVDCNKRALELFRCAKQDLIANAPYGFSPEQQPDGSDSKIKATEKIQAALAGEPQFFEWTHRSADGALFDAEVSLIKFTDEGQDYLQAIVRDITGRKQARVALEQSEIQLRALSRQLIRAQEDERKRLSRELHDELGQKLAGLKLEIATLKRKPEMLDRFLDNADELLGSVNADLRRIYNALRPVTIDKLGLPRSLEALVKTRFEDSHFTVETDIDETLKDLIPEDMAMSIYRICQEIFTNAIKHSDAHRITVTLKKHDNAIILETADDGKGFDPGGKRESAGFGLLGMKERARQHGGDLRLESSPGNGVRICAWFPLPSRLTEVS